MPPVWADGGMWTHMLGTDGLGRDYLSRMIYGARVSLTVGFFAAIISGLIGSSLGIIGGYFGGRDHTTVLHAVRTIKQQRTYDDRLRALLEEICHSLGAAGIEQGLPATDVSGKPVGPSSLGARVSTE